MESLKILFKGIYYTILSWIAFILIIAIALICAPIALIFLMFGSFMYASDPTSIIDKHDNK